jgi:hypothetical protein
MLLDFSCCQYDVERSIGSLFSFSQRFEERESEMMAVNWGRLSGNA